MPDVTTTTDNVRLVAGFVDGDERTIRMPNPRTGITKADIQALDSLATGVLIGDKYSSDFSGFKAASYIKITKKVFDLSNA